MLLLRHIGEAGAADRLEGAVSEILRERRYFTEDLKVSDENVDCAIGTREITAAIIRKIKK